MIIDPEREGCTIWENDKVQYLKGSPKECVDLIAKTIIKRCGCPMTKDELGDIDFNISLDVTGMGRCYVDIFEHYGIKIHEIRPGKILI